VDAWYGDPNNQLRGADVTDTLRAFLGGDDALRVAVTNDNMGCDPVPGVVKVLRVTVSFADGKRETRYVAERQCMVLEGLRLPRREGEAICLLSPVYFHYTV
jgi:hypothetical protein